MVGRTDARRAGPSLNLMARARARAPANPCCRSARTRASAGRAAATATDSARAAIAAAAAERAESAACRSATADAAAQPRAARGIVCFQQVRPVPCRASGGGSPSPCDLGACRYVDEPAGATATVARATPATPSLAHRSPSPSALRRSIAELDLSNFEHRSLRDSITGELRHALCTRMHARPPRQLQGSQTQ